MTSRQATTAKASSSTARPADAALTLHASEAAAGSKPPPARPQGGLYVTATPIGNLGDVTLRALDLLAGADVVACEDTRVTARLLAHFGLRPSLQAYHEHNAARVRPQLLRRLAAGEIVVLVSDAGTPLISDPGYKLVRAALEEGLRVTALPGASAVMAALVLSGLPTDRFLFAGFLPPRSAPRRAVLAELAGVPATLVFLESPRRLAASLRDMEALFGPRPAAVARELTKLFEEVQRAPLGELAQRYEADGPPRGEVVVVVGPPEKSAAASQADLDDMLRQALGHASLKEAAVAVSAATGLPRRAIYARALALKAEDDG